MVLVSFPAGTSNIKDSFAGMIAACWCRSLRRSDSTCRSRSRLYPAWPAREVAVGALGTVYALQGRADDASLGHILAHAWSLPTALSFLAWYVYAPQCIASLAVARRETNSWKWTTLIIVYLFAMAYIAAGATYWIAKAAGL